MEITNENVFNVRYNTKLDKLELRKKNKLLDAIHKHKVVSILFTILIMFSCLNFFLIYNFVKILENIWNLLKNEV